MFGKKSTATTTVTRVRFRSTMCVPPCDCGVKPMPPRPVSRPECIRISPTSAAERRTWMTAKNGQHAAGRVARRLRAPRLSRIALRRGRRRSDPSSRSRPRRPTRAARCRCVASEPREHDHARRPGPRSRICSRRGETVQHGHRDVHQDDVRLRARARARPRRSPSAARADDVDPPVGREDRLERLGEETLVVGDQHAHLVRPHIAVRYSRHGSGRSPAQDPRTPPDRRQPAQAGGFRGEDPRRATSRRSSSRGSTASRNPCGRWSRSGSPISNGSLENLLHPPTCA